jgi:hypothetical protein
MPLTAPDKRRFLAAIFLALAVGAWSPNASAWWANGIDWMASPHGGNVGDCFGNCGAGCSNTWNVCGGPPQYWDLTLIAGPDLVASSVDTMCEDRHLLERTVERYQAVGTWTYHGWVAPLCVTHDVTCSWWMLGCLWVAPCGEPQGEQSWSYDEYMQGFAFGPWITVGGPWSC